MREMRRIKLLYFLEQVLFTFFTSHHQDHLSYGLHVCILARLMLNSSRFFIEKGNSIVLLHFVNKKLKPTLSVLMTLSSCKSVRKNAKIPFFTGTHLSFYIIMPYNFLLTLHVKLKRSYLGHLAVFLYHYSIYTTIILPLLF